jgi:hypothetical protein
MISLYPLWRESWSYQPSEHRDRRQKFLEKRKVSI